MVRRRILEHLSLVESRFASTLRARVDESLEAGLPPEADPREPLPAAAARRMADRMNRRSAPETAVPSGTLDDRAALAAAEQARAALREAVQRADGRALGTVRHAHAVLGDLSVYQWMELLAGHERRHVAQIEEVRSALERGGATDRDLRG